MATAKPQEYGNESISQLKGADRVRKRPGVIFGSDGLEGCEHAVFEILSNSIDEAREGFGNIITVTLYDDKSIEVEDFGRGCPVDWNPAEKRFNWELVYCELYAAPPAEWTREMLLESIDFSGRFGKEDAYTQQFVDVLVSLTSEERDRLLLFVTGRKRFSVVHRQFAHA